MFSAFVVSAIGLLSAAMGDCRQGHDDLIFAFDGGTICFDSSDDLFVVGDSLRIIWEIDGISIDAGTVRVEKMEVPTVTTSVSEGNPAVGMRVSRITSQG